MVRNKELWEKMFKVKIDDLSDPYDFYIRKMQQFIVTNAIDDGAELFNFKFQCFCLAENDEEYQYMLDLLEEETLKGQLKFVKLKKVPYKNFTMMEYTDESGVKTKVNRSTLEVIFSSMIKKKFANEKELDVPALNEELKRNVLSKFKSFSSSKNEVSGELLDASIAKCNSLEEKLFLLEACHYEVMLASNYSRRNPNWDKFFSFMRNPLTASQQKHENQIFEKIADVLREHIKDMTFEKKKEFLWNLGKRNSKLNIYDDILAHNRGYFAHH
jgi:hypothetical protein